MSIFQNLKKFKCEPLVIFLFMSFGLRVVSMQQLLQDKVCLNEFSQSHEYCARISEMPKSSLKLNILNRYQVLLTYRTMLSFVAGNLLPFYIFVGGWCDRFGDSGRRWSMVTIILVNCVITLFSILNVIFMNWSPWTYILMTLSPLEDMTSITVIYSYITAHTSKEDRAQRMLLIQVMFLVGIAMGIFFSGLLFGVKSPLIDSIAPLQIHNTLLPYALAVILQTCALIWIFIFIKQDTRDVSPNDEDVTVGALSDADITDSSATDTSSRDVQQERQTLLPSRLSVIFDLQLLKETFIAITKDRPRLMKRNMYLIVLVLCLVGFPTYGSVNSTFPLTQIIYKWDAAIFTKVMTVSLILKPVAMMIVTPIITKLLKLSDLQICLFGSVCIYLGSWAIGTIVHPAGYALNILLSACSSCSSTGARSYLSKNIPSHEITKIYTFIQVIESIVPSIGSIIFTALISFSSDFYPTLCFHFACLVVLAAIIIVIFLDLSSRAQHVESAQETVSKNLVDTVVSDVSDDDDDVTQVKS